MNSCVPDQGMRKVRQEWQQKHWRQAPDSGSETLIQVPGAEGPSANNNTDRRLDMNKNDHIRAKCRSNPVGSRVTAALVCRPEL